MLRFVGLFSYILFLVIGMLTNSAWFIPLMAIAYVLTCLTSSSISTLSLSRRLTPEEKKAKKFEDWMYADIPDESSVWDETGLHNWGHHRGHVELVRDKDYYATKRMQFVKSEISLEELDKAFEDARKYDDVRLHKYYLIDMEVASRSLWY